MNIYKKKKKRKQQLQLGNYGKVAFMNFKWRTNYIESCEQLTCMKVTVINEKEQLLISSEKKTRASVLFYCLTALYRELYMVIDKVRIK